MANTDKEISINLQNNKEFTIYTDNAVKLTLSSINISLKDDSNTQVIVKTPKVIMTSPL